MRMTLEIIGAQAGQLGSAAHKVFAGSGGSIGRAPDNDWVIQDAYISSHHARIHFRDGRYLLEDTSTNGVFLNSPDNRLVRAQPYPLQHGDRFYIDAYEIHVNIVAEAAAGSSPLQEMFGAGARGAQPIPDDPFAASDPFAPRPSPQSANSGSGMMHSNNALSEFNTADPGQADVSDPLQLLGLDRKAAPQVPRAEDLARRSPVADHYRPPIPIPAFESPAQSRPSDHGSGGAGGAIPDDYDPLSDSLAPPTPPTPRKPDVAPKPPPAPAMQREPSRVVRDVGGEPNRETANVTQVISKRPAPGGGRPTQNIPPRQAPPPPPPQRQATAQSSQPPQAHSVREAESNRSTASGTHVDMTRLLLGAGLSPGDMTPELMESFGRILNVVVAGLMETLRAREKIKDEFRMRMTTFKAQDNNPLKFSANVEDALHNLLVKRNAAYLGPVEAFEDAFADVRNHQMAMLAGMRTAFDAMLAHFEPDHLQEKFDRQLKRGSLLSVPGKLRYWELYRDSFRDMVGDAEACFRELFGEEFGKAYEEQMQRLKMAQRHQKK